MATRTRAASAEDYSNFARWLPMLGSGDPVPSREDWCERFVPSTVIAESGGVSVGYCYSEVFGMEGYVRHLVVDPDARRAGVGRALLEHVASSMRAQGCVRWRLNVKPDNVAAVGLYEAMGLTVVRACCALDLAWSWVSELLCGAVGPPVTTPSAAQCSSLEARFELAPGQLAAAIRRPEVRIRAVVAQDASGIAVFDPTRPVVFPFHADALPAALCLLRDVRSLAKAETTRVVVEGDAALEGCLIGAGARIGLRFVHMRGPV